LCEHQSAVVSNHAAARLLTATFDAAAARLATIGDVAQNGDIEPDDRFRPGASPFGPAAIASPISASVTGAPWRRKAVAQFRCCEGRADHDGPFLASARKRTRSPVDR